MKVAVFLDYANIAASARQKNCNVDCGALLDYLADEAEGRTLQTACAYVSIDPRQEHAMDATINELWQAGYIVKSKVGTIAGETYKIVPDRVKATNATYFGNKEPWRKQVITEQVLGVSKKFFKKSRVELDDDCNWVVFERFLLPDEWRRANHGKTFVPMMLIFPTNIPTCRRTDFICPRRCNFRRTPRIFSIAVTAEHSGRRLKKWNSCNKVSGSGFART